MPTRSREIGYPVRCQPLAILRLNRVLNAHFLAFSVSKGAKLVIMPTFLQIRMAAIQTMDFSVG
jgi:hypothetical protein